jgi:predicted ribonuclease YlaK
MKKRFVLDTNVLLADPAAIFGFAEHDVVIPMTGWRSWKLSKPARVSLYTMLERQSDTLND